MQNKSGWQGFSFVTADIHYSEVRYSGVRLFLLSYLASKALVPNISLSHLRKSVLLPNEIKKKKSRYCSPWIANVLTTSDSA